MTARMIYMPSPSVTCASRYRLCDFLITNYIKKKNKEIICNEVLVPTNNKMKLKFFIFNITFYLMPHSINFHQPVYACTCAEHPWGSPPNVDLTFSCVISEKLPFLLSEVGVYITLCNTVFFSHACNPDAAGWITWICFQQLWRSSQVNPAPGSLDLVCKAYCGIIWGKTRYTYIKNMSSH